MKKIGLSTIVFLLFTFSSLLNAQVKGIDVKELSSLKKTGIKIIDIRKAKDIKKTGVIPSSYRLNFYKKDGTIHKERWLRSFVDLVNSTQIKFVLISSDGKKAEHGAKLLHDKKGYKHPYYLIGGIEEWMDKDKKTVPVSHLKKSK